MEVFRFDQLLKLMVRPDGTFNEQSASLRLGKAEQQQLTMQLGIELLARDDGVQERVKDRPYFAQYVYDALYYVQSRHNSGRGGAETDKSFRLTPDLLRQYLWCSAQGEEERAMPKNFISPADANFLFGLVRSYIRLLANPDIIRERTRRYATSLGDPEEQRLWQRLANAVVTKPIVEEIPSR
jgi:hypothetical protein